MQSFRSELEVIDQLFIRGGDIERDLTNVEETKTNASLPICFLIDSKNKDQKKIVINDEMRTDVLAIIENDLEQGMEDICKKVKHCNIRKV